MEFINQRIRIPARELLVKATGYFIEEELVLRNLAELRRRQRWSLESIRLKHEAKISLLAAKIVDMAVRTISTEDELS